MFVADLLTCEWDPGSNRSIVDPVVAVARLDVPPATRAVLVEKMRRHHFDAVVGITWAEIKTLSGDHRFGADITNMNFAAGRLCKTITRATWSLDRVENAIVYVVDGRAWGYAAACGNLFELPVLPPAQKSTPVGGGEGGTPSGSGEPVDATPQKTVEKKPGGGDATPGPAYATPPAFYAPGGGFYAPCCFGPGFPAVPGVPVTPVPEPATWLLTLAGLALLSTRRRLRA